MHAHTGMSVVTPFFAAAATLVARKACLGGAFMAWRALPQTSPSAACNQQELLRWWRCGLCAPRRQHALQNTVGGAKTLCGSFASGGECRRTAGAGQPNALHIGLSPETTRHASQSLHCYINTRLQERANHHTPSINQASPPLRSSPSGPRSSFQRSLILSRQRPWTCLQKIDETL